MSDRAPEEGAGSARRFARRLATPLVGATIVVALLSASLWSQGAATIEDFSSTLMGIRRLVSGDSDHYLAIADALRQGDFRMEHVEPGGGADRAHRQPGFPALLALAETLGAEGAPNLARVDVAVLVASLWIAFLGVRIATGSSVAGLLAAAFLFQARFVLDIATSRLLTEPLYVAVSTGAVAAALAYATRQRAAALVAVACLGGMAYLVRVNGLLLAASLAVVVLWSDWRSARAAAAALEAARAADPPPPEGDEGEEEDDDEPDPATQLPLGAYAAALALFVVVTAPSWVPRAIYAGNPVYHGYLPNFLWVDEYSRAHVPGPPRYGPSTYLAEHTAGDAARRLEYGVSRVFVDSPLDRYGPVACTVVLVALAILVLTRDAPGLMIAIAGVLQAMPLAWTALANPARRLPATALLPFAAIVVAAAGAALIRRTHPKDEPAEP